VRVFYSSSQEVIQFQPPFCSAAGTYKHATDVLLKTIRNEVIYLKAHHFVTFVLMEASGSFGFVQRSNATRRRLGSH
jgi:hypothetical protein